MIKKISNINDHQLDRLVSIWLNSNIDAHSFIDPDYWKDNESDVRRAFPNADIYVYEVDGLILGFIGLIDNYIAGIFVDKFQRGAGIGTKLLNTAKKNKDKLELNVFEKNEKAIIFYKSNNFIIIQSQVDKNTDENEFFMEWNKKD